MNNWIKGSVLGLALAVTSVLGGVAQANTVTYTAASAGFSQNGITNGTNGYDIADTQGFSFDFSDLNFSTITSFLLDVIYKRTNDQSTESWAGTVADGLAFKLAGVGGQSSRTAGESIVTLVSNTPGFLTAFDNKYLRVTFGNIAEDRIGSEMFFLRTMCGTGCATGSPVTKLTINYTPGVSVSAVPLPAGGLLLLTGLGGLMLARRRNKV